MPDSQFQMPEPEDDVAAAMRLTSMRADVDRIQASNKVRITEFARLAGPPGMMALQLDLLSVRIFTLARKVFGDGSHALVQFQLDFECQVSQILQEAVSKVRQAQLGAKMPPQAVQEMARRNGLLGPDGRPLG